HLQPGLVGLKPLATGLVPTQGVLALLDSVFYIPPAVIDLGHLAGRQPGTGDHKTYTGEQLARCHSILATTRRDLLQLFAWYCKSTILTCTPDLGERHTGRLRWDSIKPIIR